jgi:F-type H+-transporting ATPase subunit a
LLDSHDFHLFSYGKEQKRVLEHLSIPLLWDNGIPLLCHQNLNMVMPLQNQKYYAINHHNGQIYKSDASMTKTQKDALQMINQ